MVESSLREPKHTICNWRLSQKTHSFHSFLLVLLVYQERYEMCLLGLVLAPKSFKELRLWRTFILVIPFFSSNSSRTHLAKKYT